MEYDPYNPIPRHNNNENQELANLLNAQSSQMAAENYDKVHNSNKLRKWASLVIYKYSKCEYFDATVPYIAMTYFDRYISRRNHILQVMSDIIRDIELLALCCLTLAWKMRDINFTIPRLQQRQPDLTGLTTMEFHRVELKILRALDWNLRVVTAFCFVPYFIPKCVTPHGFNPRSVNEIIVGIQCHEEVGIAVAKIKPSVITASALVAATKLLYHRGLCKSIEKEMLQEAHERQFETKVFSACDAMKLAIESDIIIVHQIGSGPPKRIRIRVRAGGLMVRHKLVGAGSSLERWDFLLKWSPAMGRDDVFVIFGGGTRMAWPCGQDAEKKIQQSVRSALESAVRDLYVERLRLMISGIFA